MAENIANVADYANAIADEQANKAYEKGFKTQQANVDNLLQILLMQAFLVLLSAKVHVAFVSNFKANTENELNDYALKHQYEPEKYKRNLKFIKKKV